MIKKAILATLLVMVIVLGGYFAIASWQALRHEATLKGVRADLISVVGSLDAYYRDHQKLPATIEEAITFTWGHDRGGAALLKSLGHRHVTYIIVAEGTDSTVCLVIMDSNHGTTAITISALSRWVAKGQGHTRVFVGANEVK